MFRSLQSLATIEQVNSLTALDLIQQIDPALFMIKVALEETGVNPNILPRFIRALGNLAYGTGYGKVQVFVENKKVTQIKGEESALINEEVIMLDSF